MSFYQANFVNAETDIKGGRTLWCYNDFRMDGGTLQTLDTSTDTLKVGTATADGTAFLLGGTVNIDAGANAFGTLNIKGTTGANNPIVDVGTATLVFKGDMTLASNQCDVLTVGGSGGTGRINFNYNGGTTTVSISPIGSTTTGHKWKIIFFGS